MLPDVRGASNAPARTERQGLAHLCLLSGPPSFYPLAGEDHLGQLPETLERQIGELLEWQASGRGWMSQEGTAGQLGDELQQQLRCDLDHLRRWPGEGSSPRAGQLEGSRLHSVRSSCCVVSRLLGECMFLERVRIGQLL